MTDKHDQDSDGSNDAENNADAPENATSSKDDGYAVGYGKPPISGRFKKGQSGNPKGRKKSPPGVSAQMQKIWNAKITVTVGGVVKNMSRQEYALTNLTNTAAKGDLKALQVVLDIMKSHDGQAGSTIDAGLLSDNSQEIIAGFMEQLNVGEPIDEQFADKTRVGSSDDPNAPNERFSEASNSCDSRSVDEGDVDEGETGAQ